MRSCHTVVDKILAMYGSWNHAEYLQLWLQTGGIGVQMTTRLIERRPKALETKEELLVVLIHIQALDTSPCYT